MDYKIDFRRLERQTPFTGIWHRFHDQAGLRLRLVEYLKTMPPHWCERAHYGYLLEGAFEIQFPTGTIRYQAGDGIFIPPGKEHRHRGVALTEKAVIFFLEDSPAEPPKTR